MATLLDRAFKDDKVQAVAEIADKLNEVEITGLVDAARDFIPPELSATFTAAAVAVTSLIPRWGPLAACAAGTLFKIGLKAFFIKKAVDDQRDIREIKQQLETLTIRLSTENQSQFPALKSQLEGDLASLMAAYDGAADERLRDYLGIDSEIPVRGAFHRVADRLGPRFSNPLVEDRAAAAHERQRSLAEIFREVAAARELRLEWPPAQAMRRAPKDDVRVSDFTFFNRYVPVLYGRDNERQELRNFRDAKEPFLFTFLIGEGGMGKSRLALEWLDESAEEWDVAFVRGALPKNGLADWKPRRQTLLIDYAAAYAAACHEGLYDLARREDTEHRVRVLFLERFHTNQADWVTSLLGNSTSISGAAVRRCSWPHPGSDRIPEPIRLEGLSPAAFKEVFERAYWFMAGTILNQVQSNQAEALFASPEFRERRKLRPLYAIFCALRAKDDPNGDWSQWKSDQLEEYMLQHEEAVWQQQNPPSQADVNALTFVTACRGVTFTDWNAFPESARGDLPTLYRMLSHDDQVEHLPPYEPDPVADVMVLGRLNGTFYKFGTTTAELKLSSEKTLFGSLSVVSSEEFWNRFLPYAAKDATVRNLVQTWWPHLPESLRRAYVTGLAKEYPDALNSDSAIFTEYLVEIATGGEMSAQYIDFIDGSPSIDEEKDISEILAEAGDIEHSGHKGLIPPSEISNILETLDRFEVRLQRMSPVPRVLLALSTILGTKGVMQIRQGNQSALVLFGKALAFARRPKETPDSLRIIAMHLDGIGAVLLSKGDRAGARSQFEESWILRDKILKLQGTDPDNLRNICISLNNLAQLHEMEGNLPSARLYYEESLKLARQVRAIVGEMAEALRGVEVALNSLGQLLVNGGEIATAWLLFRECYDIAEKVCTMTENTPQSLGDKSVALNNLGGLSLQENDRHSAEGYFMQSLGLIKQIRAVTGPTFDVLWKEAVVFANLAQSSFAEQEGDAYIRQARLCLAEIAQRYPQMIELLNRAEKMNQWLNSLAGQSDP